MGKIASGMILQILLLSNLLGSQDTAGNDLGRVHGGPGCGDSAFNGLRHLFGFIRSDQGFHTPELEALDFVKHHDGQGYGI